MSLAIIQTRALVGLNAPEVTVEVHLSHGLPAFNLVGLAEAAVKESKDRVRSAIINSQFEFPAKRITVNLAPADLPKEGGRFDLAIALGILLASKQLQCENLAQFECLGELALTGHIRPVKGAISAALACNAAKHILILPTDNGAEADLCQCPNHIAANLLDVCAHLSLQATLPSGVFTPAPAPICVDDFADVRGQFQAKRALEIAAAGHHNILMCGPPGCGKSMLAKRLNGILPALETQQVIEQWAVASLSHASTDTAQQYQRPFRQPHHSASAVALVGGGNPPRPGEISLAHHGVLFLDELPEFQRGVLEALREPLENRHITISRASQQAVFPADFQLVAAMNPCPCGYYASDSQRCRCSLEQIRRYRSKISGPLLDRIDMHIHLQATASEQIIQANPQAAEESSAQIQQRVIAARNLQLQRQGKSNHLLDGKELQQSGITDAAKRQLQQLSRQLQLSARGIQRAMRVARTIADLAASTEVQEKHIVEALSFRQYTAI